MRRRQTRRSTRSQARRTLARKKTRTQKRASLGLSTIAPGEVRDAVREEVARRLATLSENDCRPDDPRALKALQSAQDFGITVFDLLRAHLEARIQPSLATDTTCECHPLSAMGDTSGDFAEREVRRVWGWGVLASHLIAVTRYTWHEIQLMWR